MYSTNNKVFKGLLETISLLELCISQYNQSNWLLKFGSVEVNKKIHPFYIPKPSIKIIWSPLNILFLFLH